MPKDHRCIRFLTKIMLVAHMLKITFILTSSEKYLHTLHRSLHQISFTKD